MKPGEPEALEAGIRVRVAGRADAGAVARLLAGLGYPASLEAASARIGRLAGSSADAVFVAEWRGDIHGLATVHIVPLFHRDASIVRITSLVVDPAARGRGVGRALLLACDEVALANGAERVEVTSGERRSGAHAFYERLGFARQGVRLTKSLVGPGPGA